MQGVIRRRREFLHLMRALTLESGAFTVHDIQRGADVPRSTAQDWINRLIEEGCVTQKERKQGRTPARYAATSALPSSACRKIFTTVDGDMVEIYHECLSGGCAAFCGYHHGMAGGVVRKVQRDGTLLRECAVLGQHEIGIGLFPAPAVGVLGVRREGDWIVQRIRCTGGPAYSLTDMMSHADGVCQVDVERRGDVVEGEVRTRALSYLVLGVDDTDTREAGATFALSLALLQYLGNTPGVIPIGHHVAMLNPSIQEKTAGNSCSSIELAAEPGLTGRLRDRALLFMEDESFSSDWGIAIKEGFRIPRALRLFGARAREERVNADQARALAEEYGVLLHGGRGVIGALAAVGLSGLPYEVLLNARAKVSVPPDHPD
ncbi:hypothetical protein J2741_001783 [Methanolinea mesophila]|uniref:helix-turn-helix domain-containing protein n=1 Tax=Methanolinea mesophila TaxID=547055 RepID=UPI001AE2E434|nr:helix-turn-helix domain-containing protein [Methanolinea mesophila]MBP1929236.1 hypothetical protein [Methanolinea mesophila]